MAKRTAESESELQPIAMHVRFGDIGTPHRSTPAVGKFAEFSITLQCLGNGNATKVRISKIEKAIDF